MTVSGMNFIIHRWGFVWGYEADRSDKKEEVMTEMKLGSPSGNVHPSAAPSGAGSGAGAH